MYFIKKTSFSIKILAWLKVIRMLQKNNNNNNNNNKIDFLW